MNAVLDFLRGAAPWAAMGLLLAIFAARAAAKDRKGNDTDERHSAGGGQE